jgi:hypothetical protein
MRLFIKAHPPTNNDIRVASRIFFITDSLPESYDPPVGNKVWNTGEGKSRVGRIFVSFQRKRGGGARLLPSAHPIARIVFNI